ncbi:MAG: hypothetical protein R3F62_27315 [Planctomycetota bacterium]
MAKRASTPKHTWEFRARFRHRAFGWRSKLPIQRIKEAVSEIQGVAKKDAVLAAEGAVLFLERVSPALEQVDSSSGAIGTAVNTAIAALVPIIGEAPADAKTRDAWLERLWTAYQDDRIPYLELLGDRWGELCATKERASAWGDRLMDLVRLTWVPNRKPGAFFSGATNCLSALLAAERYGDLLELLEREPYGMWHYRKFGVKALAALGKVDEALRYVEEHPGSNRSPTAVARVCEEILLAARRTEEAYERFGLQASEASSYLAWFRKVAKAYPHKEPAQILADLVKNSPGSEGKWFAAAKSSKLYDEAIALANWSPCDPKTLTRAARDFAKKNPTFAVEAGLAALRWLVEGYGHQITNVDVLDAYTYTCEAAENAGQSEETSQRIKTLVASETFGERFVMKTLGSRLGLR